MYEYQAKVNRVIDGDTVVLDVDLGFNIWLAGNSFRLLGCNARELHEPGGKEARENLKARLPVGTRVTILSVKVDKYGGRYDAKILCGDVDLVKELIALEWAAPWDGTGERALPPWPRGE
jgi:micrococcal nuclease